MQQEVRDNNGFNKQLLPLLEEDGIKITFSEVNKSKRGNVPKHVQRILDEDENFKHFLVVHNWISDEDRKGMLVLPEKRNPPRTRMSEREWAQAATGKFARCVQVWCGNEEFFYCHWIAKSERDVYRQLEEFGLEGKIVNSMVQEIHQFVSAYRNSDTIYREYPENGMYW